MGCALACTWRAAAAAVAMKMLQHLLRCRDTRKLTQTPLFLLLYQQEGALSGRPHLYWGEPWSKGMWALSHMTWAPGMSWA